MHLQLINRCLMFDSQSFKTPLKRQLSKCIEFTAKLWRSSEYLNGFILYRLNRTLPLADIS